MHFYDLFRKSYAQLKMSTAFSTSYANEEVVLSKQIKKIYPTLAYDRCILQAFELPRMSRFSTIFY